MIKDKFLQAGLKTLLLGAVTIAIVNSDPVMKQDIDAYFYNNFGKSIIQSEPDFLKNEMTKILSEKQGLNSLDYREAITSKYRIDGISDLIYVAEKNGAFKDIKKFEEFINSEESKSIWDKNNITMKSRIDKIRISSNDNNINKIKPV